MIWCLIVIALLLLVLNVHAVMLRVAVGTLQNAIISLKESTGETNDLLRDANKYLVMIDAAMPLPLGSEEVP